jgi:hypothetical protein
MKHTGFSGRDPMLRWAMEAGIASENRAVKLAEGHISQ